MRKKTNNNQIYGFGNICKLKIIYKNDFHIKNKKNMLKLSIKIYFTILYREDPIIRDNGCSHLMLIFI